MVFASPPRQFYRDVTNPAHLPGLSRLDKFAWTRKLPSVYRDFAKTHANPDTDGNSPYHRAVRVHYLPLFLLIVIIWSMISPVLFGVTEKKERGTRGLRSWHLHIAFPVLFWKNIQNRLMNAICKCLPSLPELSTPP